MNITVLPVATRYARRYAVVPLLEEEPIGAERLKKLAAGQPPTTAEV